MDAALSRRMPSPAALSLASGGFTVHCRNRRYCSARPAEHCECLGTPSFNREMPSREVGNLSSSCCLQAICCRDNPRHLATSLCHANRIEKPIEAAHRTLSITSFRTCSGPRAVKAPQLPEIRRTNSERIVALDARLGSFECYQDIRSAIFPQSASRMSRAR